MITDNDIKKLKQEFKKDFATKDDLKAYPTREEMDIKLTNLREDIHDDMRALLTEFRSDMYTKLDLVISELQDKRDEQDVITHQLSDHEDRISKLETTSALAN